MIRLSWKFRSWMVLFDSSINQFVSSFDPANVLAIFEFDAVWFIDFSARISINGFYGLGTVLLSLIYENPRSKFMLELMLLLCRSWMLKLTAGTRLLCWFYDGSYDPALLPWFLVRIRSVRTLDTIVCSGSLVWLFSPAWEAVKLNPMAWRAPRWCGGRHFH